MRTFFVLVALVLAAAPVAAQDRVVPDNREAIQLSFAPLVQEVAPAVVNIFTRRTVTDRRVSPLMNDPFFQRFFGPDFRFGPPRERSESSLGSGVIVRPNGLVVTNHHVIEGADQITVVLVDRREYDADVVLSEAETDLAVLRLRNVEEVLPSLDLADSDELEVGDLVLAIGNPFGVGQTVTSGIVSALARTSVDVSDYSFFIQTDAAINPGNSGGALVDMQGRLVGVNSAIYSRSGGSLGIGFAIPADLVRSVVDSVERGTPLVRPWFGAVGETVTADIADAIDLARPTGVIIERLHPASPAVAPGLAVGDVVLRVDGNVVDDVEALRFRYATLSVGSETVLTVWRDGETIDIAVPVIVPPEDPPRDITLLEGRHPFGGALVGNLSPALAEEIDFTGIDFSGVVVMGVRRGDAAARIGLRRGDVLLSINGAEIDSTESLRHLVRQQPLPWRVEVRRNGRLLETTIRG